METKTSKTANPRPEMEGKQQQKQTGSKCYFGSDCGKNLEKVP